MKLGLFNRPVIESTDSYFNPIHGKWFSVPKHWIGEYVDTISYDIK
jgi:hypothetical protein